MNTISATAMRLHHFVEKWKGIFYILVIDKNRSFFNVMRTGNYSCTDESDGLVLHLYELTVNVFLFVYFPIW